MEQIFSVGLGPHKKYRDHKHTIDVVSQAIDMLEQKVPLGLVPHVQARLMARVLRGDMEDYVPFLQR